MTKTTTPKTSGPKQQEMFPDEQALAREKVYVQTLKVLAEIVAESPDASAAMLHGALQQAMDETIDRIHERMIR